MVLFVLLLIDFSVSLWFLTDPGFRLVILGGKNSNFEYFLLI